MPIGASVLRKHFGSRDARYAHQFRGQQIAQSLAPGGDAFEAIHLRRSEGRLRLAHAIICAQQAGEKSWNGAVETFVAEEVKQRPERRIVLRHYSSVAA